MDIRPDLAAVILAAGKGKRMKSDLVKVLHKVRGISMIRHVVNAARGAGPSRIIVIVGHQAEKVMEELAGNGVEFAVQREQLGTGHAVMQARPLLEGFDGTVMVLTGDTPLLRAETLRDLADAHRRENASATVLSAVLEDPGGYGRIIKDPRGNLLRIVEHKDAGKEDLATREINSGIFCFECSDLFRALGKVDRENAQGEFYLTDVMEILRSEGKKTFVQPCRSSMEVLGINDLAQLAAAERLMPGDG